MGVSAVLAEPNSAVFGTRRRALARLGPEHCPRLAERQARRHRSKLARALASLMQRRGMTTYVAARSAWPQGLRDSVGLCLDYVYVSMKPLRNMTGLV
jgi:hypothetical protein